MEKPLHVRVAEALGWGFTADGLSVISPEGGRWALNKSVDPIPCYDTDWNALGPFIHGWQISVWPRGNDDDEGPRAVQWGAKRIPDARKPCDGLASGATPLEAICNLILQLKEAGKLETQEVMKA